MKCEVITTCIMDSFTSNSVKAENQFNFWGRF
jgi:hypothetical protein